MSTKQASLLEKLNLAAAKYALPAEKVQAERLEKTRLAHSAALLDDYVGLIEDLLISTGEARPANITRRLGVSFATAIKSINRSKREGLAHPNLSWCLFNTGRGL